MGFLSHKPTKTGYLIVRVMNFLWILFCIWVCGYLLSRGEYYPATGWGILAIVFIFVFLISFIKPKEFETPSVKPMQQREEVLACADDELVLLYSSKDIVKISQIEEALHMKGIDFTVLDRHRATMMSFLPEVEMRIMVQKKDFERSSLILGEIAE